MKKINEMAETYLNKAKEIYLDYRYYFYTGLYFKKTWKL